LPPDCLRQPRRTVSWPLEELVADMLLLSVLEVLEPFCELLWLPEGIPWVWLLAPEAWSGPF